MLLWPEKSSASFYWALAAGCPTHRALCDVWVSTRPECVEITLTPRDATYSSHLLQKYYSNPRVKRRTQPPHIRKGRECAGHPAGVARGVSDAGASSLGARNSSNPVHHDPTQSRKENRVRRNPSCEIYTGHKFHRECHKEGETHQCAGPIHVRELGLLILEKEHD
jgi:hypothetical protein